MCILRDLNPMEYFPKNRIPWANKLYKYTILYLALENQSHYYTESFEKLSYNGI